MDLSKLSAQVKGFQRRTTQKVMQQIGLADKTDDESPSYQNFLALGSFASQLKTTIQASNSCFEKSCTAQTHLAGQIQSYLHSELSGDAEQPPGELNNFFYASDSTRQHAEMLQNISGKFYEACSELGNNALHAVLGQINDLVLRPIMNDEELGTVTKDIIEEKRKATLDYDSFRRMSANTNSPVEQDRNEAKLRMAKDRFDQTNRRLAEHIDQRNQIRCKMLVHGILTSIHQYCNYHMHAFNILRDTATSLKPLLDIYQMNEDQLHSILNLDAQTFNNNNNSNNNSNNNNNNRTNTSARSGTSNTATAANSLFDEQNHRPKTSTTKSAAAAQPPRGTSPQLEAMMRDNLNLKQTAPPTQHKSAPMNQYGAPNRPSPQPVHQHSPPHQNSPQATRQQQPQQPQYPQQQQPQQPLQPQQPDQPQRSQPPVDLLGGSIGLTPSAPTTQRDILIDLTANTSFIDDPLSNNTFGGGPPPMNPSNTDPFASFTTPIQPISVTPPRHTTDPFDAFKSNASSPPPSNDPFFNFIPTTTTAKPAAPKSAPKPADDFNSFFDIPTTQPPPQQQKQQPPPHQRQQQHTQQSNNQDDMDILNPAVTQKINNWASKGGRQTNLRALLSTLHEVIWVDSGWDALSLTDLLTNPQVKKAYIRANLIVHPDKVQNGTTEQRLIAQRLFEALRVSYEAFKEETK